jgi:PD-(D/E)XK endonuclease
MASAIIETIQACGVLCELRTPTTKQPEPVVTAKRAVTLPGERPNTKRVGELAEAAFLHKAEILGLKLAKPWGDSNRYDFILDNGQRCLRIQVKCTQSINARGYQVQSTYCDKKKKAKYTPADVDILVAYVIPLDLWYIVPVEAFPASASLRFYPHGGVRRPRFEQYREAWHYLRPKPY